jgi:hypothetical protein
MSRSVKNLLTLGLALGLVNVVLAQGKQQAIFGPGSLLFHPDVQQELKLSKEQTGKLEEVLGKVMTKYTPDFEKFAKTPPTPEEVQKIQIALHEDSNKAIAGVLDDKQYRRFKQIGWQMLGIGSLLDPDMQKELKLSDEQKKKLEDIGKDAAKKGLELNKKLQSDEQSKKGEDPAERAKRYRQAKEQYDAINKEAETKAHEVLTEDQKKGYKEAMGEKFTVKPVLPPTPPPPPPPPAKKP